MAELGLIAEKRPETVIFAYHEHCGSSEGLLRLHDRTISTPMVIVLGNENPGNLVNLRNSGLSEMTIQDMSLSIPIYPINFLAEERIAAENFIFPTKIKKFRKFRSHKIQLPKINWVRRKIYYQRLFF